MLVPQEIVAIVAQATTVQEVVLVNNVQQESTRRQLLILRYPTVLIAKVAIIALEVVLN